MNILVTGANGQMGQELQRLSKLGGANYIFTDIEMLDITKMHDVEEFIKGHNIDTIINCAAYTNVDRAEEESDIAERINGDAVRILADLAKQNDIKLIHISTDYVFGNNYNSPIVEDTPTTPLSVYGRTKAMGERAIMESGCRYVIIRTSWLYSAYGNNFVKRILELARKTNELKVVDDQIGSPTYAADLALVIKEIAENELNDIQGIYHYSSEGAISWYTFASAIVELSNAPCTVYPCSSQEYRTAAVRPPYSVLDKTKIKKELGIDIPFWKDSLAECLKKIE